MFSGSVDYSTEGATLQVSTKNSITSAHCLSSGCADNYESYVVLLQCRSDVKELLITVVLRGSNHNYLFSS